MWLPTYVTSPIPSVSGRDGDINISLLVKVYFHNLVVLIRFRVLVEGVGGGGYVPYSLQVLMGGGTIGDTYL